MKGIGVDIVSITRMKETISRSGDIFLDRVFTDKEIKNSSKHCNRDIYYAGIFAAKEAVFKIFCTEWSQDIRWQDIEIIKGAYGNPKVNLNGGLKSFFTAIEGKRIFLSISWEIEYVIAFALLI